MKKGKWRNQLTSKVTSVVEQSLNDIKNNVKTASQRALDLDLNLAVTGLSGAGKTAFITALTHQLRFAFQTELFPFWQAANEGRILGCKRNIQRDLTVQRFRYDEAIASLTAEIPTWPASTKGTSTISLTVKFKPEKGLRKLIQDTLKLNINITDYPGEWLLDLPMLKWNFQQWSDTFWQRHADTAEFESVKQKLSQIDWSQEADEALLEQVSEEFKQALIKAHNKGLSWIQPGRFLLPAELEGTPALQFVPLVTSSLKDSESETSLLALNQRRYQHYIDKVVRPFYVNHFNHFDRQVLLVDTLSALNSGEQSFADLQFTLNQLAESFNYGKQSWLGKLINPKIDKVLIAATKADHITVDQHENQIQLLQRLTQSTQETLAFNQAKVEFASIASVQATKPQQVKQGKEVWHAIEGKDKYSGEMTCLFPGEVPKQCDDDNFWQENQFSFPNFCPPSALTMDKPIPHIAMDKVCEILFGDKLS